MTEQEKQDRADMRETVGQMMFEMMARHDITPSDAGSSQDLKNLSMAAQIAMENWLYAAYSVNHS